MPDWCRNTLEVRGAPADLEAFRSAACRPGDGPDSAEPFSLAVLVPMPEILSRTALGSQEFITAEGETIRCRSWYSDGVESRPLTEAEAKMVAATGATDWYDWTERNWGVRSDASGGQVAGSPEEGCLVYQFVTPWDCPRPVIAHLAERFPTLSQLWTAVGDGWQEQFIHEVEATA
jgi:hypothetical protein